MITRCYTQADANVGPLILTHLQDLARTLTPRRIVIKPNWVLHESDPAFPIRALVTDARIIQATVEACLNAFPRAESIIVGDCPLQWSEWPLMCRQSGLSPFIEHCRSHHPQVSFQDWRREVFRRGPDNFLVPSSDSHGDPRGYREVELGPRSHLEPISDQADQFAVNDYSATVTQSNHRRGSHRYYVSQSVLDAQLFINLPKWKAHQKSGITCALKNLVGINGDKAYLPHFRKGAPKWGGDEYRDDHRWLYWAQTVLRERFQKKNGLAYRVLKPGWEALKRLRGIETRLERPDATPKNFYVAGGAWPGNETIWRMIYDLNLIIQHVDANGVLRPDPTRHYFCIVDGLISGEGNGPLQPLPKETHWLLFGDNPFAIDAALTWFMGFDPARVPLIARHLEYAGNDWGQWSWPKLALDLDNRPTRVCESEINFRFAPPPGWRSHVER